MAATGTLQFSATIEGRLRRISIAILIAIAISIVVSAFSASNSDAPADVVGGDFPAFYGAGRIALEGDLDDLYSIDRQVEAQADLHGPDGNGDVWYFPYPPQVAIAYAPLALLPYPVAYVVHTLFMAACVVAAIVIAKPMIPWLERHVVLATAMSLIFWPMFRAVTGGSNTALSLLLIVVAWRFVHADREVAAGLALALLLFKPQLAVPLMGLFLVARYWAVAAGAAAGVVVFLMTGVPFMGWGWVFEWLEAASDFGAVDAEVNGHSAISVIGFTENIVGAGASVPVALAWAVAGAIALFLAWLWARSGQQHLRIVLAIAVPGVLLLSPHAMSHEGALVVLAVAIAMETWAADTWRPWVAAIWVLGATQIFIKHLGFSPGFFMLLLIAVWVSEPVRVSEVWFPPERPPAQTTG